MTERVWDRFLTEQDKRALAKFPKIPRDLRSFCNRPALVLVDFFRGVYGDRPQDLVEAMDTWPGSCGLAAWQAIPPTQRLLKACRRIGMPIIHTTGMVNGTIQGQHARPRPSENEPSCGEPRWIAPDVRYEIIPEVEPLDGETVINKISSSAFWGTPLIGHLIKNHVDTLIVCGESTSGCVRATVVDADENQFNVIVVEDCTFDRHEATHAMNLFDMHQKFAEVRSLEDVLEFLDKYSPAPAVLAR
ncbi:MAG TPA: isochorismatase family protein [Acidimicrobiales bacterium]|nr:isochorismatase family protein [Acidimicrobiales bacterium]